MALPVADLPAGTFAERVVAWGRTHGRHDLPWQQDPSPYRVWISEIMLQQTRAETVAGYFTRFMETFPDVGALARADEDTVLAHWSGLGYYARARNLHRAAQQIVADHSGRLPDTLEALTALPGIGRSTAGAILSLGHGRPAAILDGNVKRVLTRWHGFGEDPSGSRALRRLWAWSEEKIEGLEEVSAYTQRIMDLGATLCTPQAPNCPACPLVTDCTAHREGLTHLIPARRRRRALPLRETCMLLQRDAAGRIILQKRPGAGIWGGLWSLPEQADEPARVTRERPRIRHVFTHFQLDIRPLEVRPGTAAVQDAATRWFTIAAALELGLPAPVRRLLEQLQQELETEHDAHGALQEAG